MNIKVIKSEMDYEIALKYLEELMDKNLEEDTLEFNEMEILSILISKYEDEHYKIDLPDPIVAIKIIMEEKNLKQRDLIPILGSSVIVSEVLKRKRPLTLKMIRSLNKHLNIPAEVLLNDENAILPEVSNNLDFEKSFPINEMFKRNIFGKKYKKISEVKGHAEEDCRKI